jgi:hypothetical protein
VFLPGYPVYQPAEGGAVPLRPSPDEARQARQRISQAGVCPFPDHILNGAAGIGDQNRARGRQRQPDGRGTAAAGLIWLMQPKAHGNGAVLIRLQPNHSNIDHPCAVWLQTR